MKLGIVGLPNVGKSTLFNSLTKAGAESANYPFCTIDPNIGVVAVPDKRLQVLDDLYHSQKVVPAAIEFVDIAGLVKGASKGEGLGNQFLSNIREVDAIVHVVRCFENGNIVHVDGSIDPLRYPFCTIDPNIGVVAVPDKRLQVLDDLYHSQKVVPAAIEFVDIAGLVKGASKGEGLGNQFLSNIREVDAIVHVVRCFENGNIVHVDGSIDPLRDIETINLELIFSDIEILERRISKVSRGARNDKSLAKEEDLLKRLKAFLEEGKLAKNFEVDDEDEQELFESYNLLTAKPVIYAANVSEDDLADDGNSNEQVAKVREYAKGEGSEVFVICAQIEQEIAELDDEEKEMFLEDLGLKEAGLDKLIRASYSLLGLISFLTAGEQEVRAWTITKGTKAPQAAGKIHSDFERGFIRAEIVNYDNLIACGSFNAAKEKGLVRSEGKEYIVQDGDVVLFRFNV